jgi:SagB-type dehydrogenase family enzyme
MKTKRSITRVLAGVVLFFCALSCAQAQSPAKEALVIKLPEPKLQGGATLMEALGKRKSERAFSAQELSLQTLSDLLWAANGVNRPAENLRTAPTTMNMQEIDIYLSKQDGLYLYDAKAHALVLVVKKDIREVTGKQPFVKSAPVNLIFVADMAKMSKLSAQEADFYAATDTGFVSQNVYLYCASAGLSTVVRGWVDKDDLAKAMGLRRDQKVILAQTVGYPAK